MLTLGVYVRSDKSGDCSFNLDTPFPGNGFYLGATNRQEDSAVCAAGKLLIDGRDFTYQNGIIQRDWHLPHI
jgi:hypothetical protein